MNTRLMSPLMSVNMFLFYLLIYISEDSMNPIAVLNHYQPLIRERCYKHQLKLKLMISHTAANPGRIYAVCKLRNTDDEPYCCEDIHYWLKINVDGSYTLIKSRGNRPNIPYHRRNRLLYHQRNRKVHTYPLAHNLHVSKEKERKEKERLIILPRNLHRSLHNKNMFLF
jgi:hypothetical protein